MVDVLILAIQCGIVADAEILDAIVQVESRGNPHALNVNGDMELVRQPTSREEAISMARWLEAHGFNWDGGLGQVNSANLRRLGLDASTVFDPCANLRAASQVLTECYARAAQQFGEGERAMTGALSCYNTGDFTKGVTNGYVRSVRGAVASPMAMRRVVGAGADKGAKAAGEGRGERTRAKEERGRGEVGVRHPAEVFARVEEDVFGRARAVKQ